MFFRVRNCPLTTPLCPHGANSATMIDTPFQQASHVYFPAAALVLFMVCITASFFRLFTTWTTLFLKRMALPKAFLVRPVACQAPKRGLSRLQWSGDYWRKVNKRQELTECPYYISNFGSLQHYPWWSTTSNAGGCNVAFGTQELTAMIATLHDICCWHEATLESEKYCHHVRSFICQMQPMSLHLQPPHPRGPLEQLFLKATRLEATHRFDYAAATMAQFHHYHYHYFVPDAQ